MNVRFIPKPVIEKKAADDLSVYRRRVRRKRIFPLNIEDFAFRVYGLDTVYLDFEEEGLHSGDDGRHALGALFPEGKYFNGVDRLILVNNGKLGAHKRISEQMQRFTIAHEVGHYALQYKDHQLRFRQLDAFKKEMPYCDAEKVRRYDPFEFQANYYSGCVLMPREELLGFISKQPVDMNELDRSYCQRFLVSRQSLEMRLGELGISMSHQAHRYPQA